MVQLRLLLQSIVIHLVLISSWAAASTTTTYDVTPFLTDPSGEIELLGGKSIRLPASPLNGTRVVFEDTMPHANWGHEGIFKVLDASGNEVSRTVTQLPPVFLNAAKVVEGERANANEVKFNIKSLGGKQKVKNPENFYALLINGRADQRHWNDFSFLYRVLVEVYGYKKENILVADGAFKARQGDLDGDEQDDIGYGSTVEDIEEVMDVLKQRLDEDSHLLLAVNDHGSTLEGESTIVLDGGEIKASAFAALLSQLPAKKILSIHEQCFSGGFVRPTVARNRVTMAGATDNEYSWASMDLNFDEFIYHVISAFAGQNHQGEPLGMEVDSSRDGKISAKEAFAYAVKSDRRKESPVMESYRNSGDADNIGFNF